MVKILACSDLHGDRISLNNLIEKATKNNIKYVFIAGDIFNFQEFKKDFVGKFPKNDLKVFFVQGNHDSSNLVNIMEKIYEFKNIHKENISLEKNTFFGISGTVDFGELVFKEDYIFNKLKYEHQKINKNHKKILISHMHPKSNLTSDLSHIVKPSYSLSEFAKKYKIDLIITGHIHEAEGLVEKIGDSLILHTGKQGKIIDLDNITELEKEIIN